MRKRGPWLAFGGVTAVVAGLWLAEALQRGPVPPSEAGPGVTGAAEPTAVEAQSSASANSAATARGAAQPTLTTDAWRPSAAELRALDQAVSQLEAHFRSLEVTDGQVALDVAEALGPRTPAAVLSRIEPMALGPEAVADDELRLRALQALLLGGHAAPRVAAAWQAWQNAAARGDESAPGSVDVGARQLELLGALALRSPEATPEGEHTPRLHDAVQYLEFRLRSAGSLPPVLWQMARAVFRTLPQAPEPLLRLRGLRLLNGLDGVANDGDPLHAEALIAGVLALSPGDTAARKLAWRRAQGLLPLPASPSVAGSQAAGETLRALRSVRAVLTRPAPVEGTLPTSPR